MFDTLIDVVKTFVVLLLLTAAIVALPFFLGACIIVLFGYAIYIFVRAMRLGKEEEIRRAETKRSSECNQNQDQTSSEGRRAN